MITGDTILVLLELLMCALLWFLAGFAEKNINSKWRICYAVPVILCLVMITVTGFEITMLGAYIGSVILLCGFFKDNKLIRRISCIVGAVSFLVSFAVASNSSDYRNVDYAAEFKTAFKKIERFYILDEHKGIDLDSLYEKYLPRFEEATRNHSEDENIIAWLEFTAEFNDGHVYYAPKGDFEEVMTRIYDKILGNDYGLAVMTLSDGTAVAVNVDPYLSETGIAEGTVITSWNGKSPIENGEEMLKYFGFADKDNEEFYKSLYGAGAGGDTVTVTYLDEAGNEQTAELSKIGSYYSGRLKTALEIINGGIDAGHLTWTDINENTAALRIKMMMHDSDSSNSNSFNRLKNQLYAKLEELKAAGVENIILDMRDNGGGSGAMVQAVAQIFSPVGEHYYSNDGVWDNKEQCYKTDPETGKFLIGKRNTYTGEGMWDGEIVILINANSVSAADHTIQILSGFDNITVMGFTESNGSSQGVGGIYLESGMLSISGSLMLYENGDVFIDSGVDRESGNDVEIRVPFDREAVDSLFVRGEDYLLNKAVEYFNTK